ncbi:HP0495 family protein [Aestuariirhabdus sp. LZHN29]|uniref:HP0495 family protein n=1 Tax=Aestuariirhabdus sp. LZHN29 TaxID=3417462 RepID=UPI003CEEEFC7
MSDILFNQQQSGQPDAPKIEFPCDYPVKILGDADADFVEFVLKVVQRHDGDFNGTHDVKASRNGRFQSVTVVITATGEAQLSALHKEFMDSGRVKMVI